MKIGHRLDLIIHKKIVLFTNWRIFAEVDKFNPPYHVSLIMAIAGKRVSLSFFVWYMNEHKKFLWA